MCSILQKQFVSAFSKPDKPTAPTANVPSDPIPPLTDFDFSINDIIKTIDSIPRYSAMGPDRVPPILLKECKQELAPALQIMWRKSLDSGEIPKIYLQQSIIPIYKKSGRAMAANYRPISLTSQIIKLFERMLRVKLVEHLETYRLLSDNQHGFRRGRSCLTNLLHHLDSIISILEENNNADVVYIDMSKAFDKVNHHTLLYKLSQMGIGGKILKWIDSFLSGRYQQVVINGVSSEPAKVLSGVPQGTVLGPVLFIAYMNDICSVIKHSIIRIFADDSKIIKSIRNPADREKLIEDLHAILTWAKNNSMELNIDKYQLLQHGLNDDLRHPYQLNGDIEIKNSSPVKDLGVLITDNLSTRDHILKITSEAKAMAAWTLRTFESRDRFTMLRLLKTYIIPRVEYSSPCWSPYLIKDITLLESVQRSYTAQIDGMDDLDYWQRLEKLKLFSLQRRRERFIIIHCHKIYSGLAPNDVGLEFKNHPRFGLLCKRQPLKSKNAKIRTIRHNFFSDVAPRLFNIIPAQVKAVTGTEKFKEALDKVLINIPDKPPIAGYPSQNHNSLTELVSCLREEEKKMRWKIDETMTSTPPVAVQQLAALSDGSKRNR